MDPSGLIGSQTTFSYLVCLCFFYTVSVFFSIVSLLTTRYNSCESEFFNSEDKTSVVRKRYFYLFAGGQLVFSGHFLPNVVETSHRATG